MWVRTRAAAILLALCCVDASGAVADPAGSCDPMARMNDNAKALRAQQRFPEALSVVQKILAQSPDDFRANYTNALIALDLGRNDRSKWLAATKQLEGVLPLLTKQSPACAKDKNFYSIYNTLGVEYYNQGNVPLAKKYYDLAFSNFDKLNADTQGKLLDNLGLIAYRQNDFVCAATYFTKAEKAGAKNASYHLGLAAKVLSSANDKRTCQTAAGKLL